MQDVPVSHVRRTRREMSATSEETSNDGGGSNMCFKTDEADMSGVSCARLSSRPESDYWKGFSTSTYSHSRSNHVAFPVPPLRLRSGADPLSVVQDISKGCQAKASQQPESLSRNLTFSFQSGEAKLKCFLPGGCFRERPAASPLSRNLWSIINTNVADHYQHCYIYI